MKYAQKYVEMSEWQGDTMVRKSYYIHAVIIAQEFMFMIGQSSWFLQV